MAVGNQNSALHLYGRSSNPNGLLVLSDCDRTLFDTNFNENLIEALKKKKIREIYLCTAMDFQDLSVTSSSLDEGIEHVSRKQIIDHVNESGILVKGVFTTPLDLIMYAGKLAIQRGNFPTWEQLMNFEFGAHKISEIEGLPSHLDSEAASYYRAALEKMKEIMTRDCVMGHFYNEILAPYYRAVANGASLSDDAQFNAYRKVFSALNTYFQAELTKIKIELGYSEESENKTLMAHIIQAESASKGFNIESYLMFDDAKSITDDIPTAAFEGVGAAAITISMERTRTERTPEGACITQHEIEDGITAAMLKIEHRDYLHAIQAIINTDLPAVTRESTLASLEGLLMRDRSIAVDLSQMHDFKIAGEILHCTPFEALCLNGQLDLVSSFLSRANFKLGLNHDIMYWRKLLSHLPTPASETIVRQIRERLEMPYEKFAASSSSSSTSSSSSSSSHASSSGPIDPAGLDLSSLDQPTQDLVVTLNTLKQCTSEIETKFKEISAFADKIREIVFKSTWYRPLTSTYKSKYELTEEQYQSMFSQIRIYVQTAEVFSEQYSNVISMLNIRTDPKTLQTVLANLNKTFDLLISEYLKMGNFVFVFTSSFEALPASQKEKITAHLTDEGVKVLISLVQDVCTHLKQVPPLIKAISNSALNFSTPEIQELGASLRTILENKVSSEFQSDLPRRPPC